MEEKKKDPWLEHLKHGREQGSLQEVLSPAIFDAASLHVTNRGIRKDFHLNGEPKSGTTWLEYLVKETLEVLCKPSHKCSWKVKGRLATINSPTGDANFGVANKHTIPGLSGKNSFHFCHPPNFTDEEVLETAQRELIEQPHANWIAIFRDPRDVTISACYHEYKDCPDTEHYVQTHLPRVVEWVDLRHRFFKEVERQDNGRVLNLYYEELKASSVREIQRLGFFLLGLRATAAEAVEVQRRASLSSMKAAGGEIPQGGAKSGKVRKGSSCGFRSELSPAAASRATEVMRQMLVGSALQMKWQCCDHPERKGCSKWREHE